jgi:hypothetical protein
LNRKKYREMKPEFTEGLQNILLAFAAGAVIGFVGFVWRIGRGGLSFKRDLDRDGWMVHFQAFMAPFTLLFEVALCFPYDVNIFGISSHAFQTTMKPEGKMLLEYNCQRILAGAIAMAIICLGSFRVRNLSIHAPHTVLHLLIGGAYLAVVAAHKDKGTGGTFEIPSFLHFGCAVGNGLSYVRSYRKKIHDILRGQAAKQNAPEGEGRLKQE